MRNANRLIEHARRTDPQITVTRNFHIALPPGERAYIIPVSEWERMKKMVIKIAPRRDWFIAAASACVGVCATAAFCLIGLAPFWKEVPAWAKATGCSVAASTAVLALALFYLNKQQTVDINESAEDVFRELEQLEKSCQARAEAEGQSDTTDK
jgi:hypothetical protein